MLNAVEWHIATEKEVGNGVVRTVTTCGSNLLKYINLALPFASSGQGLAGIGMPEKRR